MYSVLVPPYGVQCLCMGISRFLATHLFGKNWKSERFSALEDSYCRKDRLPCGGQKLEVPLHDGGTTYIIDTHVRLHPEQYWNVAMCRGVCGGCL